MIEVWKDIEGFEGLYQVSNTGKVRGLERVSLDNRHLPDRILTGSVYSGGYVVVKIRYNGRYKRYLVHRLVAKHFIPNPKGLPMVNHKDENKTNNCVDNLEWCDALYNCRYGTAVERSRKTFVKNNSKKVMQFTLDGKFLKEYDCIADAAKATGTKQSEICCCCRMKESSVSSGGYMWRYSKDCPEKIIPKYNIKPSSLEQKVAQFSAEGKFIAEFKSIADAVRTTKARHSSIYACCVGRYKTANGYIWKYVKD